MAIRTDSASVQAVLLDNYDGSSDLTTFIGSASRIVDRVVACATRKGVTLDSDEQKDVETYVAAYLYFGNSGQQLVQDETTEKASVKFADRKQVSEGYLSRAKMIDASGCLSGIIAGKTGPRMEWLGKPPSSQIPYTQRD